MNGVMIGTVVIVAIQQTLLVIARGRTALSAGAIGTSMLGIVALLTGTTTIRTIATAVSASAL